MRYSILVAALATASASQAGAQQAGFTFEGELEVAAESVLGSDTAGNELTDITGAFTLGVSADLGGSSSFFATLVGESVTDPTDDRAFEDIGFYLEELGVAIEFGSTSVALGKTAPTFGRTWDDAAGYFNDIVAEDYEQTEQIGVFVETELATGGVLSFAAYYADNTALSRSMGTDRGRVRTPDGGAGNTGRLNNVALAWTQEFGNSSFQIGARHLSAGAGDASDETGLVASFGHNFGENLDVFAEVATFDGFGGGGTDATYATLTAAYTVDAFVLSAGLATRDDEAAGRTNAILLGADYEFSNGIAVGSGLAFVDDAGNNETVFGVNVVIPFGS